MNKIYNKTFYSEPGPKHLEAMVLIMAKNIGVKKVLDVGSGSGWLVKALRMEGFEVYGCDSSPLAFKKDLVVKADATNLPFENNSFDLVTAISLIEHLNPLQTKKFLKEVGRVLKPRGYFFLVTPNYGSPLRLIQGKKWHGYNDPTHIKFYTVFSLGKLLKESGFGNLKITFSAPEEFDWILPNVFKKTPRFIKKFLNFLIVSTVLTVLKNSISMLAQNTKKK